MIAGALNISGVTPRRIWDSTPVNGQKAETTGGNQNHGEFIYSLPKFGSLLAGATGKYIERKRSFEP